VALKSRIGALKSAGDPGITAATYPCRKLRAAGAQDQGEGSRGMSVLVVGKFQGDTAKFRQALIERGTEFAQIADRARESGAMHHRFGIGDGFVMIIDEWESPEHFQKFFSDPSLREFIGSVGASPAPPEVTITESIGSPDQF